MSATAYPPSGAPGHQAVVHLRRFVNDEIAKAAVDLDGDDGTIFEFLCECGDLNCRGLVEMTLAEYRTAQPGSVVGH